MKKIISIFLLLLSTTLIFTSCVSTSGNTVEDIQKKGKITLYTEASFPPFEYVKDGSIIGVDIDIANEIAKDLNVNLEVKDAKFDSLLSALGSGKADFVAAGLSKTEDRLKQVDFSIVYSSSRQAIISKSDSRISDLELLKGKKIGVQTGTTSDIVISELVNGYKNENSEHVNGALQDTNVEIKQYNSPLDATQDLITGRIDAVIVDEVVGSNIIQSQTGLSLSILKDTDGDEIKEVTSIAINKGNTSLVDAINKTLERLLSENKISEYFINHSK